MQEKENEFNANYQAKQVPAPQSAFMNRSMFNHTVNASHHNFNQTGQGKKLTREQEAAKKK